MPVHGRQMASGTARVARGHPSSRPPPPAPATRGPPPPPPPPPVAGHDRSPHLVEATEQQCRLLDPARRDQGSDPRRRDRLRGVGAPPPPRAAPPPPPPQPRDRPPLH